MAGLLGDSWDDPKTQAVMSMAAGLLGGGSFGQALGRGLGGYQETMGNAKKQALIDEQMQWKRDEIAREKADREQQLAKQSNIQRLIRESFLPTTGTQAIQGDALGPTVAKAQSIGQTRPIDFQALAAQDVPYERLKQLADSANLGRSKVARTVKGMGPDGREYEYQVDEYGNKVGDGMAQFRAPMMQDLGGKVVALDPYTLQQKAALAKSMSPEGQASNAVAWANNGLSRQRLAFDMAGGAEAVNGGKPQFKDGMWVMPPKNMQPGQAVNAMAPVAQKDAVEALNLIDQARKVIPQATGSGIGQGVDAVGRFFGKSTQGDTAIGQLQALEGALVAKMPKMSGPQSDKDVALYKQMAGVIGDPSIPQDRKLAALSQIEEIQRRYAGDAAPAKPQSTVNFVFNPATGKLESR
jgi:hypothetical protein